MNIALIDAGNYFRGLLLLIRKDGRITETESGLMKRIGRALGFEKGFCENAIREVLENEFILDEPPEFSTKDLAKKFIKDGLTLASSDHAIHSAEEEWLKFTSERNDLDLTWFLRECEKPTYHSGSSPLLEVELLAVM